MISKILKKVSVMIKKLSITLLLSLFCSVGFSQTCKDACSNSEGGKKEKSRKERKCENSASNSSCGQIQSCDFSGGQEQHPKSQCHQTVSIPVCFLDTSKCNAQDCCGDLDNDGNVTVSDLLIFLNNYPPKGEESKRCCKR